ncbi:hypothetical protein [Streptomyces megasporus]|uniref:hypothetical protein n=1 Tax=Streptomyces megasporus TaxID=44060 RepID=UPI0004E1D07D|nr:hypothetical protein [Streptomyces megasporus]
MAHAPVGRSPVFLREGTPKDRLGVARGLGGGAAIPESAGDLPLVLHDLLLKQPPKSTVGAGRTEPFTAGGHVFWWLGPRDGAGRLDSAVGLAGHRVVWPDDDVRAGIAAALDLIATRPWAMDLVSTYVTTFALAETERSGTRKGLITSCSLPDFPLCVFFSPRVFVHIPPLSIHPVDSVRMAAENLYHEAVHQAVNYQLLAHDILVPEYDSARSPKIPIYWRQSAGEKRNRAWELDRVLHAASVYCHLLHWRYCELVDPTLDAEERKTVINATTDSIGALKSLCDALSEHIDYFTSEGALLVGRLIEAAETRTEVMRTVIQTESIPGTISK